MGLFGSKLPSPPPSPPKPRVQPIGGWSQPGERIGTVCGFPIVVTSTFGRPEDKGRTAEIELGKRQTVVLAPWEVVFVPVPERAEAVTVPEWLLSNDDSD